MPLGVSSVERPGQLDPGGPAADDIAPLWWGLLAAGTVIALLVAVLLVLPMVRRRRRMPDASADHDDVPQQLANRWIIGLGVVMPGAILIAVLVFSVSTMRTVSRAAPAGSVVIDVVSYQFWWAASYPADDPDDDVIVANEIHIPVGEPVELRLTSADVIHSFWAPELVAASSGDRNLATGDSTGPSRSGPRASWTCCRTARTHSSSRPTSRVSTSARVPSSAACNTR